MRAVNESHHFEPVFVRFRFNEPYYTLSRLARVTRNRAGDVVVLGVIRTDAPAPGTGGVLVNGLKKGKRGDADDDAAAIAVLFA